MTTLRIIFDEFSALPWETATEKILVSAVAISTVLKDPTPDELVEVDDDQDDDDDNDDHGDVDEDHHDKNLVEVWRLRGCEISLELRLLFPSLIAGVLLTSCEYHLDFHNETYIRLD